MEPKQPFNRGSDRARPRMDMRDAQRLLDAAPPHAIEAEMSLLGSILIDPKVVGDVVQLVRTSGDFFRPAHGAIFEAMVGIWDRTASLDVVQLNQQLLDRGILDDVGGTAYLVELAESVPTAAHASEYARLVRDKATLRELIRAAGEILADAQASTDLPQQVLEAAEQRIFAIAQRRESAQFSSLQELLDHAIKVIDTSDGKSFNGTPTGFAEFDEITSGLQKGEMIVLAARPSMGKTAFALNMMENAAAAGHADEACARDRARSRCNIDGPILVLPEEGTDRYQEYLWLLPDNYSCLDAIAVAECLRTFMQIGDDVDPLLLDAKSGDACKGGWFDQPDSGTECMIATPAVDAHPCAGADRDGVGREHLDHQLKRRRVADFDQWRSRRDDPFALLVEFEDAAGDR